MKWYSLGVSSLLCIGLLTACGSTSSEQTELWSEQSCTGHMTLQYATEFSVDYYDPYALITIADNQQYLLVPEKLFQWDWTRTLQCYSSHFKISMLQPVLQWIYLMELVLWSRCE